MMLDTTHRVATPEGIEITLRLAGPIPRAFAALIDLSLRILVIIVVSVVFGLLLTGAATGITLIVWFVLEWLVGAWFEAIYGATPGKMAMGLHVLQDDGSPISWSQALTRNVLRAVDFLPAGYALGLLSIFFSKQFKRLGDYAANTLVVYRDDAIKPKQIPQREPMMPAFALSLNEQRTILDFAERAPLLTPERTEELALIVQSVLGTPENRGDLAAEELLAIANYLTGKTPVTEQASLGTKTTTLPPLTIDI